MMIDFKNDKYYKSKIKEIIKILKECEYSPCLTKLDSIILLEYINYLKKEVE